MCKQKMLNVDVLWYEDYEIENNGSWGCEHIIETI